MVELYLVFAPFVNPRYHGTFLSSEPLIFGPAVYACCIMNTFDLSMMLIVAGVLGLFCLGLFLGLMLGKRGGRLEAEKELPDRLSAEREDAVRRSRAVLGGQVAEQLAPYLPDFPCSFEDARFLGKPLDYVCFSGASSGKIDEIVFVEVKTGEASLSKVEKSARQAIIDGRIRWVEYRIPLD